MVQLLTQRSATPSHVLIGTVFSLFVGAQLLGACALQYDFTVEQELDGDADTSTDVLPDVVSDADTTEEDVTTDADTDTGEGPYVLAQTFTFREPSGLTRRNEHVQVGVPLPERAGITDPDTLRVTVEEVVLDSQVTVLSRWYAPIDDTSAPIRWALVQTQLPLLQPDSIVSVEIDQGESEAVSEPLTVTQAGTVVTVDTGSVTVDISPLGDGLLQSVIFNGEELLVAGQSEVGNGHVVTLTDGRVFHSGLDTDAQIEILSEGPLRSVIQVQGTLRESGGAMGTLGDGSVVATTWFEFHRGSAEFHVTTSIVNLGEYGGFPGDVASDSWLDVDSLSFAVPFNMDGGSVDSTALALTPGPVGSIWRLTQEQILYEPSNDNLNYGYEIFRDSTSLLTGGMDAGKLQTRLTNTHIGIDQDHFWEFSDQAITLHPAGLEMEYLPEDSSDDHRLIDGLAETDGYDFEGGRRLTRSFTVNLQDVSESPPEQAWVLRNNKPVIGFADARYYALVDAHPFAASTPDFEGIFGADSRVEAAYTRYNQLQRMRVGSNVADRPEGNGVLDIADARTARWVGGEEGRVYWHGWRHFGDVAWGGGYASHHYDMAGGFLFSFLRLGERNLWNEGMLLSEHSASLGMYWGEDTDPLIPSLAWRDSTQHGAAPETEAPSPGHHWMGRLVLQYSLTGDPLTLMAIETQGQSLLRYFNEGWNIASYTDILLEPGEVNPMTSARILSNGLGAALDVYDVIGDTAYLTLAQDITAAMAWLVLDEGAGPRHLDGLDAHAAGENEATLLAVEPLIRYHRLAVATGAADAAEILQVLMAMRVYLEADIVEASGSGENYVPSHLYVTSTGPDGETGRGATYRNGYAASLFAYLGLLEADPDSELLGRADRLWADMALYPEYLYDQPAAPPERDESRSDLWSWGSSPFGAQAARINAIESATGLAYLWVLNQRSAALNE